MMTYKEAVEVAKVFGVRIARSDWDDKQFVFYKPETSGRALDVLGSDFDNTPLSFKGDSVILEPGLTHCQTVGEFDSMHRLTINYVPTSSDLTWRVLNEDRPFEDNFLSWLRIRRLNPKALDSRYEALLKQWRDNCNEWRRNDDGVKT